MEIRKLSGVSNVSSMFHFRFMGIQFPMWSARAGILCITDYEGLQVLLGLLDRTILSNDKNSCNMRREAVSYHHTQAVFPPPQKNLKLEWPSICTFERPHKPSA